MPSSHNIPRTTGGTISLPPLDERVFSNIIAIMHHLANLDEMPVKALVNYIGSDDDNNDCRIEVELSQLMRSIARLRLKVENARGE